MAECFVDMTTKEGMKDLQRKSIRLLQGFNVVED